MTAVAASQKLYLARHGDTAWTESRQHTGRTDLPLNERGEQRARELGGYLRGLDFACVFTSPLQRVGVLAFEHDNVDEPIIRLWNHGAGPAD